MGIAIHAVDARDAETLVRYADIAMLRSKELGPTTFSVSGRSMSESVPR